MIVYPYKSGSKSVKALKQALGIKAINVKGNSKFKGNPNKIVINWGSSSMSDEAKKCKIINKPEAVELAANKFKFFEAVKEKINIPEYTLDKDKAYGWIESDNIVFSREKLSGNSGDGIVILENLYDWENYNHEKTKMYVKYIPKKDEFRIHVSGGQVIDMQRKAKRHELDGEDVNWKIRSYDNGFIFKREGVEPHQQVLDQAVKAVELCGLDFGAVDIIWNNFQKKAYVLEVNTAPGLEGSTVDSYKKSLKDFNFNWVNELAKADHILKFVNVQELGVVEDDEVEEFYEDDEGPALEF
jgi:glutathione synthase/RimK-type ligase-like ATP-grasp enzyme